MQNFHTIKSILNGVEFNEDELYDSNFHTIKSILNYGSDIYKLLGEQLFPYY